MYVTDTEAIPTGEATDVPPGPWDDCFTNLAAPPQVSWPDGPTVTITSSCSDWVVYDRPPTRCASNPRPARPTPSTASRSASNRAPH